MYTFKLDALASSINLIGAAVLAVDAFLVIRRVRADLGDEDWARVYAAEETPGRHRYWRARISFWRSIGGFSLVAFGFALDLYTKVTGENCALFHWHR